MKNKRATGMSAARPPKPWQDKDGNTLSDEYLRTVSKSWLAETWQAYLESLETEPTEIAMDNLDEALHRHDLEVSLQNYCAETENEANILSVEIDEGNLSQALGTLSGRERQAIDLVFFRAMNVTEAAQEMGIRRQSVSRTIERALRTLRKNLRTG